MIDMNKKGQAYLLPLKRKKSNSSYSLQLKYLKSIEVLYVIGRNPFFPELQQIMFTGIISNLMCSYSVQDS